MLRTGLYTTLRLCVLSGRAQGTTVWRTTVAWLLLGKGVDGKLWRVLRDHQQSTSGVNGDMSDIIPLERGSRPRGSSVYAIRYYR
jgi:hypothetical protein